MLKRYFTLVDTRDLDAWRAGGELPPNPAMITFDDGYRDNHDVVLPILKRHDAKAVFFIATSYVADRRLYWWEHINHVIADSTAGPADPGAGRRGAAGAGPGAGHRRRSGGRRCKVLLKLVKAEPGLDMDRFLDELYRAAGLTFDRDDELAPGRRDADELGPHPQPEPGGDGRAVALAQPPGAAHLDPRRGQSAICGAPGPSWRGPSIGR